MLPDLTKISTAPSTADDAASSTADDAASSAEGPAQYRITLVGCNTVGKTSLVNRYCKDEFTEEYSYTYESTPKLTEKSLTHDGDTVELTLVDTGGSKINNETAVSKGWRLWRSHGIMVVFAVSKKQTFEVLGSIRERVLKHIPAHTPMLLVAHKSDVEADREVTPEEIQTLAGEWNVPHVEVSCLNSVNVDKAFEMMIDEIKSLKQKIHKGEAVALTIADFDVKKNTRRFPIDKITSVVEARLSACPLSSVDFSNVEAVTDLVLWELALPLVTYRHLTTLSLDGCTQVSNAGVCYVARQAGRLETVSLQGCRELDERALSSLLCVSSLRTVAMAACDVGVVPLQTRGTPKTVGLVGCPLVVPGRKAAPDVSAIRTDGKVYQDLLAMKPVKMVKVVVMHTPEVPVDFISTLTGDKSVRDDRDDFSWSFSVKKDCDMGDGVKVHLYSTPLAYLDFVTGENVIIIWPLKATNYGSRTYEKVLPFLRHTMPNATILMVGVALKEKGKKNTPETLEKFTKDVTKHLGQVFSTIDSSLESAEMNISEKKVEPNMRQRGLGRTLLLSDSFKNLNDNILFTETFLAPDTDDKAGVSELKDLIRKVAKDLIEKKSTKHRHLSQLRPVLDVINAQAVTRRVLREADMVDLLRKNLRQEYGTNDRTYSKICQMLHDQGELIYIHSTTPGDGHVITDVQWFAQLLQKIQNAKKPAADVSADILLAHNTSPVLTPTVYNKILDESTTAQDQVSLLRRVLVDSGVYLEDPSTQNLVLLQDLQRSSVSSGKYEEHSYSARHALSFHVVPNIPEQLHAQLFHQLAQLYPPILLSQSVYVAQQSPLVVSVTLTHKGQGTVIRVEAFIFRPVRMLVVKRLNELERGWFKYCHQCLANTLGVLKHRILAFLQRWRLALSETISSTCKSTYDRLDTYMYDYGGNACGHEVEYRPQGAVCTTCQLDSQLLRDLWQEYKIDEPTFSAHCLDLAFAKPNNDKSDDITGPYIDAQTDDIIMKAIHPMGACDFTEWGVVFVKVKDMARFELVMERAPDVYCPWDDKDPSQPDMLMKLTCLDGTIHVTMADFSVPGKYSYVKSTVPSQVKAQPGDILTVKAKIRENHSKDERPEVLLSYTVYLGGTPLTIATSPQRYAWRPAVTLPKGCTVVVQDDLAQPIPFPANFQWQPGCAVEFETKPDLIEVLVITKTRYESHNKVNYSQVVNTSGFTTDSKRMHPLGYAKHKKMDLYIGRESRYSTKSVKAPEDFDYQSYLKEKGFYPMPYFFFTDEQTGNCPPLTLAPDTVAAIRETKPDYLKLDFVKCATHVCHFPNIRRTLVEELEASSAPSSPYVLLPSDMKKDMVDYPFLKSIQHTPSSRDSAYLVCGHYANRMHLIDTPGVVVPKDMPEEEAKTANKRRQRHNFSLEDTVQMLGQYALKIRTARILYQLIKQRNFLPNNIQHLVKEVDSWRHTKLEDRLCKIFENIVFSTMFFLPVYERDWAKYVDIKEVRETTLQYLQEAEVFQGLLQLEGMPLCEFHKQYTSKPSGEDDQDQEGSLPPQLQQETNHLISELSLPGRNLDTLPDYMFERFPNLEELNLENNKLTSLPDGISKCIKIATVNIKGNHFKNLSADFVGCQDSLTLLDISGNPFENLPEAVYRLTSLVELQANNIILKTLKPAIKNLKSLLVLSLAGNVLTTLPKEFSELKTLRSLNLSGMRWIEINDRSAVFSTDGLNSFINKHPILAEHKKDLYELFTGCSGGEKTMDTPGIQTFNAKLYSMFPRLQGPEHSGIPKQIFELTSLRLLDLSYQALSSAPDKLRVLESLEELWLSYNPQLVSLAAGLSDIGTMKALHLRGCPTLKTPPREIVAHGFKAIFGYLKRLNMGSVECKRTKLMMVGLGGAGKTSLVKALKKYKPPEPKQKSQRRAATKKKDDKSSEETTAPVAKSTGPEVITDGIDITDWTIKDVTFSMWDFAGQTVYYNTHQFFMSNRAVYLLLWNIRLGYEHAGLDFWLSSIACHAPRAPVLVLGTHSDQVEKFWLPREQLQAKYPQICGFHTISCLNNTGIDELAQDILEVALQEKYMGEQVPEAWLKLETTMLREREKNKKDYLMMDVVEQYAEECAIVKKHEVLEAIQFLHDLGSIQHFSNVLLKSRVVINPQWIVDAMACVVSVHDTPVKEGRLRHEDVSQIWRDFAASDHTWLLRLTEEFDLTFPLRDEAVSVVPCLLPAEEPEISWEEVSQSPSTKEMKMVYEFGYLPAGLFNRAQVRLYQFSDGSVIWKQGSLLKKNGHMALLRQIKNHVHLRVLGPRPENMVFLVHEVFEGLLVESFHGVTYDYHVPCSDCIKETSADPSLFPASKIRRASELKAPFLQCDRRFHVLSLHELHALMPPDNSSDFDLHLERNLRDLDKIAGDLHYHAYLLYNNQDVPRAGEEGKRVHPARMRDDLDKNGLRVYMPPDPSDLDMKVETLKLREVKVVLVCISDNFVADAVSCRTFLYIKENLQKPIQLVVLGQTYNWQSSQTLGMHVATEVFVNMTKIKNYDNKFAELLEAVKVAVYGTERGSDPPPCFISYCWKNSAAAVKKGTRAKETSVGYGDPREIKTYLEKKGIQCWLDIENVGRSTLYEDIAIGLNHAKVVVVCVSDEYCDSRNCKIEFRYAASTLNVPMIVAVVGQGLAWRKSEIGMLTVDFPQVNLQQQNADCLDQLHREVMGAIPADALTTSATNTGAQEDSKDDQQQAFKELLEVAQRKFQRQVCVYADAMATAPYPRLLVLDYTRDEEKAAYRGGGGRVVVIDDEDDETENEEEHEGVDGEDHNNEEQENEEHDDDDHQNEEDNEDEDLNIGEDNGEDGAELEQAVPERPTSSLARSRPKSAMSMRLRRRVTGSVTDLRDNRDKMEAPEMCVRYLCEHEEGWHEAPRCLPLPSVDAGQFEEFLGDVAPYMARLYAVMKHTDLTLPVLNTARGEKLRNKLRDKCSLESEYREEYQSWRRGVMEQDAGRDMGGLARCHLASGKLLWLCPDHQRADRVTVLSDDVGDIGVDTAPEIDTMAPMTADTVPPTATDKTDKLQTKNAASPEVKSNKPTPSERPGSSKVKTGPSDQPASPKAGTGNKPASPKPTSPKSGKASDQQPDKKDDTKKSKMCLLM